MSLLTQLLRPAAIANITGLTITVAGALINTRGAIVEGDHAKKVAHTAGDHNKDLEAAMQTQSRSAKDGFRLIALGASLQIAAEVLHAMA